MMKRTAVSPSAQRLGLRKPTFRVQNSVALHGIALRQQPRRVAGKCPHMPTSRPLNRQWGTAGFCSWTGHDPILSWPAGHRGADTAPAASCGPAQGLVQPRGNSLTYSALPWSPIGLLRSGPALWLAQVLVDPRGWGRAGGTTTTGFQRYHCCR